MLTEELVEIEGKRNRLLMAQGKSNTRRLHQVTSTAGDPGCDVVAKAGTPDEILAELSDIRLMVLGRKGSEHKVGSHLENVIRIQKKPLQVVPDKFSTPDADGNEESRKNVERLTVSPLLKDLPCHIVMINGDEGKLRVAQQILRNAGIEPAACSLQISLSGMCLFDMVNRYG